MGAIEVNEDGTGKRLEFRAKFRRHIRAAYKKIRNAATPLGDTICQECGRENPCWFADNDVWNRVIPQRSGVLCPACFIKRADPIVPNTGWKLVPDVAGLADETAPKEK